MGREDAETYRKYAAELIRFAAVLVGPSAAEDVLSTAILKAFSAPGWADIDNQRAYLYRTIVNEAAKSRRTTQRRLAREIRAASAERGPHAPNVLDPDITNAIRQLEVRERAVVYLTYWADLAPSTIATTLAVSERTIERTLSDARRKLEELLS
jgi:RNA polymerase sigma factor (sigma-70 family)